jgi:preprotein translocase subunit SecD
MDGKYRFTIILGVLAAAIFAIAKLPVNLGLDLQGGMRVVLEAQDTEALKVNNDAMLGVLAVIRNRVDGLGVAEPVIFRKGERQVVVELPGVADKDRAIRMIGETALLEFVEAEWAPGDVSKLSEDKLKILIGEHGRIEKVIDKDRQGNIIRERSIILKQTGLTGSDLKWAGPQTNQYGQPQIGIEFSAEGAKKFAEVTKKSVGRPLAILLDGKVISAPNVNEPIFGGKAQISGSFSLEEVTDLIVKLKAGSLPVPVEIVENKSVGATLGKDSIQKSLKAGIIGFIAVAFYLILYYRLMGFLATIALGIYFVVDFGLLSFFHVTLTLPGIAGLILSVGMAVDANVIIFERIIEERRTGLTVLAAVQTGFKRAITTILDSNITTLITATVLFWLGSGSIRGFAVTLSIGIVVSMFSAIFVTRTLINGFANLKISESRIFIKG